MSIFAGDKTNTYYKGYAKLWYPKTTIDAIGPDVSSNICSSY